MKKTVLLAVLFLLSTFSLHAQGAAASTSDSNAVPVALGHSVVALAGPWKFHVGDDPQWSDPNFDDSSWETVSLNAKKGSIDPLMGFAGFVPGWTAKGHPGYSGFAWYRIRVRITGADEPLAFLGPSSFDDSYQLFVKGHLIGSFGDFDRPVPTVYVNRAVRFAMPQWMVQSGPDGTTVIAVRFFMAPRTLLQSDDPGGFHSPPIIGLANGIAAAYHVRWEDQYRAVSSLLAEIAWSLIFAILILMLYVFDRTEIILLWPFSACMLGALTWLLLFLEVTTKLMTALQEAVAFAATVELWQWLWLMAFWAYFGLQDRKWLRNAIAILFLWRIFAGIFFQIVLLGGKVSHSVFAANAIDAFVANAVALLLAIAIAWLGWRRPQREHWTLFVALFFFAVPYFIPELLLLHIPTQWFPFGVPLRLTTICDLLLLVFFSFVLLRHFRSSQRRQQAMEQDVKQAQEVQQVLIPVTPPNTPGFEVESVYLPANEVGGDFFQILAEEDGSLLIVMGDVSGKGLKAAMTVSTIVGALRNETSREPAQVLANLNRVLHGQITGFATCCAARITSDGIMTIANAGHIPPYRNGQEIAVQGGLPLGILAACQYEETQFEIARGDRLTFVSDGVVEATNVNHELFGFARTQAISHQTAQAIAEAAKNFGQEDDISVLSVTRLLVEKEVLA